MVAESRGDTLVLGYANQFLLQQAAQPEAIAAIEHAASAVHPGQWRVQVVGGVQRAMTDSALARRRATQLEAQSSLEALLRDDPAVRALQRAFDAVLVQVSPERAQSDSASEAREP